MTKTTDTSSVSGVLKQARAAVEEAELPDDLREAGFQAAIKLLGPGGDSGLRSRRVADPPKSNEQDPGEDTGHADATGELTAVASSLDVADDQVDRIFDDHGGVLQFCGDVEKLGKSKSARVEKLAVLLMAARQDGGYDEQRTDDGVIRAEVDRHGLLDPTNYTKHVKPLKKYANVNGAGKTAIYKVKFEGRKEAKELAAALLAD